MTRSSPNLCKLFVSSKRTSEGSGKKCNSKVTSSLLGMVRVKLVSAYEPRNFCRMSWKHTCAEPSRAGPPSSVEHHHPVRQVPCCMPLSVAARPCYRVAIGRGQKLANMPGLVEVFHFRKIVVRSIVPRCLQDFQLRSHQMQVQSSSPAVTEQQARGCTSGLNVKIIQVHHRE